ncbi:MAG: acyl-CoA desaturase [Hamadaea sp.]|nr:acyl-CoA desaturase [Hamadaea sp.]
MNSVIITPDAAAQSGSPAEARPGPKPLLDARQSTPAAITMWIFVVIPFVALAAAIPLAWGWGLSAVDIALAAGIYVIAGFGVTAGYHRLLTHGSFKARRGLRIALAVAGSFAVQGSPIQWVANHRRHHAFSDREGDPHSPWRYGTSVGALLKGLGHAHVGWMLRRELSNRARFAPDMLSDKDMRLVGRLFGPLAALSLIAPAIAGGLLAGTWTGALTAFFWAGLVLMALLHHVTWAVNSVCHVFGERPFESRDKATNFWPLAILSFGESWHNSHHADPTGARHGVMRGQIDPSARLIWIFEKLGWARDVRWPVRERLEAKLVAPRG